MIIDRVIELLEKEHRTQKELSEALGLHASSVNNWIVRHTDPAARYIIPICEFLGVSCEYLLTGTEASEVGPEGGSFDREDLELLRLIQQLPHDAKIEFRGEIKGYLKGLAASGSLEEPAEMKQAK